jgi:hypothetical protein
MCGSPGPVSACGLLDGKGQVLQHVLSKPRGSRSSCPMSVKVSVYVLSTSRQYALTIVTLLLSRTLAPP